ncbi:MAG: hypothetical protein COV91_00955 [Candidatus Taylorbacteria bacterium CG11_big_fil_rev_8_21_14_0_20_46_11]|uniref:DUF4956 domain-containing protein n=1 Tax=Candidatus Taylorbacteria bacterium CG11_big_fil_rev_8_21_14_0_20_46_11 TaxID=1975025 RepID=A0A2H0KEL5_9BACT|nr:MAG: hypothetical protein COV91_00955 [Candidatus Taylorbacteria bacterium CG11_big_fil_rev_8_21_14_0_20_46_11]
MTNFYNLTQTEISSAVIVFNLLFSLILLLVVVYVYKKTHQGLSYSPSFVFTLVIVGILGSVIMMVVQNNLFGAFALLGAFSLIRFRTILKETRDIAFVLFALVIGVSVGTNNYSIALISTVVVSLVIILLTRFHIGSRGNMAGFVLTFTAKSNIEIGAIRKILTTEVESFDFLQARSYGDSSHIYAFSVTMKDSLDATRLIEELNKHESITDTAVITGEQTVEY